MKACDSKGYLTGTALSSLGVTKQETSEQMLRRLLISRPVIVEIKIWLKKQERYGQHFYVVCGRGADGRYICNDSLGKQNVRRSYAEMNPVSIRDVTVIGTSMAQKVQEKRQEENRQLAVLVGELVTAKNRLAATTPTHKIPDARPEIQLIICNDYKRERLYITPIDKMTVFSHRLGQLPRVVLVVYAGESNQPFRLIRTGPDGQHSESGVTPGNRIYWFAYDYPGLRPGTYRVFANLPNMRNAISATATFVVLP